MPRTYRNGFRLEIIHMIKTLLSFVLLLFIIPSCSQLHTAEPSSYPQVLIKTSYAVLTASTKPQSVPRVTSISAYPVPYAAPSQGIESFITAVYPPPESQNSYTPPSTPGYTATPSATTDLTNTPTPTIIRPTPTLSQSLSSLRIVYTINGKLWLWTIIGSNLLTTINETTTKVKLSDDGEVVAFNRDGGLWVINTNGTGERLLVSEDDFKEMQPTDPGVILAQLGWIPYTHILLFNTRILTEYGITNTDDLHWVNADSGYTVQLLKPHIGGYFQPSPDGKMVAIVTPKEIRTMNIDGSNYHTALEYPSVVIPSEAWYYAQPIWANDSKFLVVAIPPKDLYYGTNEPMTIWKLLIDGSPPILVSRLAAGYNEYISPDLSTIIIMRFIKQDFTDMIYEIHISNLDGSKDMIYQSGPYIFQTWALDSKHFVLWEDETNNYWLGQAGTNLMVLTESSFIVGNFDWIDYSHFIYLGGQNGLDELRIGTAGEPSILIAAQSNNNVPLFYDWKK